ncbi:MAG: extensin family protein [Aestuariivirga sp.]|nr:extensin family protein [Aestuariivirga sp.]
MSLSFRRLRFLLALILMLLVSAYGLSRLGYFEWPRAYDPLVLPDLDAASNFLTPFKLKRIDSNAENCRAAFARAGKAVAIEPTRIDTAQCSKQDTIKLANLSTATLNVEETRCAIAARLFMWEHNIVQPAASKYFNEPVTELLHFGSYSCRNIRGSSAASEHATANAFDISGFRLRSGKLVTLKQDWQGSQPPAEFLREVRGGACDYFNVVLSPDYNADHHDHLHVDMGWYRSCR